jgi:AcrR family transcriptional regulator
MEKRRSLRAEHVQATRDALTVAGRSLFGQAGFAATSVEDIAAEAGVTIGALYHHFSTKADLFDTVFEGLHRELRDRSVAAASGCSTALTGLLARFDAFLDAALEREFQRILFMDAPAVVGAERYHEVDERYSYADTRAMLEAAIKNGEMPSVPDTGMLAHLLLGAVYQGAVVVSRSQKPEGTRAAIGKAVHDLLARLAAAEPPANRVRPRSRPHRRTQPAT